MNSLAYQIPLSSMGLPEHQQYIVSVYVFWVFFLFSLLSWSFSKTSVRRQPIQNVKMYLLTGFSKKGRRCPTCSSDCKASPVVGRMGLVFSIVFINGDVTFCIQY